MSEFKYIVVKVTNNSLLTMEVPFIFPKKCVHKLMFESIARMYSAEGPMRVSECVSAGFIDLVSLECYGEPETLNNLKSRGKVDSKLIMTYDYGGGIL